MGVNEVLIVGFIVFGIYKLFELFVRKSERMALIEKLSVFPCTHEAGSVINFPEISFMQTKYDSWPLRLSLLFMGVGLGCLLAFLCQFSMFDFSEHGSTSEWAHRQIEHIRHIRFVLNFSFIAVFGGLGLFVAYLIERKQAGPDK